MLDPQLEVAPRRPVAAVFETQWPLRRVASEAMSIPVVLDVDTGVDDALAILFAIGHRALDVRAITCVDGNTTVDKVSANTRAVLDVAGAAQLEVARGAQRPLVNEPFHAEFVHGNDGLANSGLAASTRPEFAGSAVELLRRSILDSAEPVTVVALGPLTNIALLLRAHPEVAQNLDRIVFMGGAVDVGNATAVAEFNVWHDPEAAAIVIAEQVPVLMYPLEPFLTIGVPGDRCQELIANAHRPSAFAGRLLAHLHGFLGEDPMTGNDVVLGDAGALCALVDPSRMTIEELPVAIELAPGRSRGQTIVDRRRLLGEDAVHGVQEHSHRIEVVLAADSHYYQSLYLDTIESLEG